MIEMYVGIMTNFNKPTELARLTSLICKNYNINIIYLRPKDVNMEKDSVTGKVFRNNRWVKKKVDIPPFIDIAPYCFLKKNKEIMDYLRQKAFLSDNRSNVLTKEMLQEKLKDDERFAHLLIPTHRVQNFEELQMLLKKYDTVVLKPVHGLRGKGVYKLSIQDNGYKLGIKTMFQELSDEQLKEFYEEFIKNKGYIIQKYVTSRTLQGDPFDCRIHVEKNGKGNWESARNYIRIGIGQTVISNVNQGGGISDPESFLKANFGEKWREINKQLNELATTLPYKIEELRNTHIMSLGLDVGIGKDGKLYLFEVNDGPATAAVKSEVAFLRSNYYKYVLEHILKLSITPKKKKIRKNLTNITKKIEKLEKENAYYKKKLKMMEESTSWRLTKPVRDIGEIMKLKRK